MEEQPFSMDSLYEKARDYADTTIELARLKAVRKAAEVSAELLPRLVVFLFLLLFVFCANIALGLWLGALMGAAYYGFLAMAGAYMLLGLIVRFFLRERMGKSMAEAIISKLLS